MSPRVCPAQSYVARRSSFMFTAQRTEDIEVESFLNKGHDDQVPHIARRGVVWCTTCAPLSRTALQHRTYHISPLTHPGDSVLQLVLSS